MTPAAVAPPASVDGTLHASIVRLARGASIETSTRNLAEIDGYAERLPPGADVFAAWLPGTPYHHLVSVAKRLRQAGLNPVPHIAARRLASEEAAREFLALLRDEAQVTRALLIAGDSAVPVGPFESSLSFLETGLLEAHGICSIGIAGYPEGHPRIAWSALEAACDRKLAYAARNGIDAFIVSQFCFDPDAIVAWVERLRAGRVTVPIRIGVAGIATIRTLLNYARRCGIGSSIRALGSDPISLPRLLMQQGPETLVRRIAAAEAGASVAGLHCFAFGGFAQGARWLQRVAAGRFRLDDTGFAVEA
ncbi:MAG TPA: methylenetetrahydrofolate reductase [Burkholderiales bacterium]|nr:methylenetetrahydrofolate reductase [Burkholderiales bacterium]